MIVMYIPHYTNELYLFRKLMPNKSHEWRADLSESNYPKVTNQFTFMTSDQINNLLNWCSANAIQIDPRLQIKETIHAGIGVFSRDADIECDATRESVRLLDNVSA
jgi:hypothetical protein